MLKLCRARAGDSRVSYMQADLFAWEPERTYDECFFGFWLSHVPEECFEMFWGKVRRAVGSDGRLFFIDSVRHGLASAVDHELPEPEDPIMLRRLDDGREYHIVKRFYEPRVLQQRLAELGWDAHIQTTGEFFIYGQATPSRIALGGPL